MKCHLRTVILLTLAFIAILYTAQYSDTVCNLGCNGCPNSINNATRKTHILLLATTRSGSSFVGELLNYHSDVFYLYEPLYHVGVTLNGANQKMLIGASRDLLQRLYSCDLHFLESFIRPLPTDHTTNRLWRRGMSKALCSPPLCDAFTLGEDDCLKKCKALNMTLASESCKQRHVALKIVRVPEIGELQSLVEDPRLNLRVIQLVRDPRGILVSHMHHFPENMKQWWTWKATGKKPKDVDLQYLTQLCNKLLKSISTGLSDPHWLKGKYMLLRYEDIARNPLQNTKEIYDYLGFPMDKNVVDWIQANTKGGRGSDHPYSTVRDSAAVAERWRLNLPFDMVEYMQDNCQETLSILGYKRAKSAEELGNMSLSLVQDFSLGNFL